MEGVGGSRFPDHILSWVNGKLPCIIPFPNQVIIPVCSWRGSYGIPDGLDVLMAYWKLPFIPFNDVRYFCIPWQSYGGEMRQEVIESSSIWQLVVKPCTRMLLDHSQYTRPSALYTTLYSAGSSSRTRRSWRACLCARRDAWQTCPGNFWGFHLKLGQHGRTSSSHPQNWGGWWHFSCISSGLKSRCCVAFCRMPPNPSIASIKRCLLVIK